MNPEPDGPGAAHHEPFRFRTADSLRRKAQALGVKLPFSEDLTPLLAPAPIAERVAPNRIVVQPMEGVDGALNGAPTELTVRRYRRFAKGGSGVIWFEATSAVPDGRSNPHALMLNSETLPAFIALVQTTRRAARTRFPGRHEPFLIVQVTHAGRFSGPAANHVPRVADGVGPSVWTDAELDRLRDTFVDAIRLAAEAGFDAVDVKACHGYLVNELLAARGRGNSRYGGDFAGRTRFLLEVIAGAREEVPSMRLAVRLNAADFVPRGFGMAADGSSDVDVTEPVELVRRLRALGCCLLNVTAGVPRFAPHIGRPCDRPAGGGNQPCEHPLAGVTRLLEFARVLQEAASPMPVVGTGFSWLRQFWPHVAAGAIGAGFCGLAGVGRLAFAYPDAPADLMTHGALVRSKCCVTCSYCTELMRAAQPTGCVVRDREVYAPPRTTKQQTVDRHRPPS
ncbi:MAG: hypothetical protein ACM3NQ_25120 [Bacteroidales bacterium]